jgi:hypothetical protein
MTAGRYIPNDSTNGDEDSGRVLLWLEASVSVTNPDDVHPDVT